MFSICINKSTTVLDSLNVTKHICDYLIAFTGHKLAFKFDVLMTYHIYLFFHKFSIEML